MKEYKVVYTDTMIKREWIIWAETDGYYAVEKEYPDTHEVEGAKTIEDAVDEIEARVYALCEESTM